MLVEPPSTGQLRGQGHTATVLEMRSNRSTAGTLPDVRFLPAEDFSGNVTVLCEAEDPHGASASSELRVDVVPVPDTPLVLASATVIAAVRGEAKLGVAASSQDRDGSEQLEVLVLDLLEGDALLDHFDVEIPITPAGNGSLGARFDPALHPGLRLRSIPPETGALRRTIQICASSLEGHPTVRSAENCTALQLQY